LTSGSGTMVLSTPVPPVVMAISQMGTVFKALRCLRPVPNNASPF
jgi:hypothetical protein